MTVNKRRNGIGACCSVGVVGKWLRESSLGTRILCTRDVHRLLIFRECCSSGLAYNSFVSVLPLPLESLFQLQELAVIWVTLEFVG